MEKLIVTGGKALKGKTSVSGAKNVALKALVAACLTNKPVIIHNMPLISDVDVMVDVIEELGGNIERKGHTFVVHGTLTKTKISLENAAEIRTAAMFVAPLLARFGTATIPNPGGCRIGARPIDRIVNSLEAMNVVVTYDSTDGYFHAKSNDLKGTGYTFEKNTHTGTETLILTAVLASGKTIIHNAAEEPEVDELIGMLVKMGAKVERTEHRTIVISGVKKLHGVEITIGPDRNEIVTIAVGAILTNGDVFIKDAKEKDLKNFLAVLDTIGAGFEMRKNGIRFFAKGNLKATDITTAVHPGIMTDWQGPLALLLTQAVGASIIHETVYENRFGYVSELRKMGAKISLFHPDVRDPKTVYNFNVQDDKKEYFHAAKISGPTTLHNAVLKMTDIRAGATLVLAALAANGESVMFGVEYLDRGYEAFENRLKKLGAEIWREED